ncbi:MAG: sigma 54-interacting transcriptional regulator [Persephonella sp.]|nr:sigma 54-interacting transcriptional regulator [Persephonella sp.]
MEFANGGTLFLDEIGDMPLSMQAKLLRFLEDFTFTRVGGNETLHANVRIIAATNVNLEEAVKKGRFREDLFYRLNVLTINIPPLEGKKGRYTGSCKIFSEQVCKGNRKGYKGVYSRS